jgi:chromosome segregation ATPase
MSSRRGNPATASARSTANAMLDLTKALQTIHKHEDNFNKSVEKLKVLLEDTFSDLANKIATFSDLANKIDSKQKELESLTLKYEQEEKNKKIEVDQFIKEYAYNAAIDILNKKGEIAVKKDDFEELNNKYNNLKSSKDQEIKEAVESEKKKNDRHNEAIKRTLELQKQAEVAKVEAQLETQVQHIDVLKKTIEDLKKDLDEQRKLTKDVAQAASKNMGMWGMPQQTSSR